MLNKPNSESSLNEWLSYLEKIHPTSIDLGLERVKQVAQNLEVLKLNCYIFTVAGTNGKGTTCRALEMILLAAGLRVGVYSSPHISHYTERVRINNQEVSNSKHVSAFNQIEIARGDISLTYFEYSTLSALLLFKQANLDVIILEVGLGGRLDATNIIEANVAVITSIALDHIDYLGNNRESIGQEKAGIFKPHCIAIIGEPDIPQSIYDIASEKAVQFHSCYPNIGYDWQYTQINEHLWHFQSLKDSYDNLPIPKIPLANAATALAALNYSSLNIDKKFIYQGLAKTELTGRFQIIQDNPLVIIDVAHNPHAAIYLSNQLKKVLKQRSHTKKLRLIIGMLKDKDIQTTVQSLHADVWYCASLYGERGASSAAIAANVKNSNDNVFTYESVKDAWKQAISDAEPEDIIVVCGSFHTVSEVLELITNEQ